MGRMALPMNILLPVLLVVLLPDAALAAVQLPTIFKVNKNRLLSATNRQKRCVCLP